MRRLLAFTLLAAVAATPALAWESKLYPSDWKPGVPNSEGMFLHDFSYAGYHQGMKAIPRINSNIIDVSQAPYSADRTGVADVTAVLQKALDDAGAKGGGVVYLPAGTYRIRPRSSGVALSINYSNVVLRGAGTSSTFLFNDEPKMRHKTIIQVSPSPTGDIRWQYLTESNKQSITQDLLLPTRTIPVASTSGFSVGDHVIVRADATSGWISEHKMSGKWYAGFLQNGIAYYRIVTGVNAAAKTITVDIPTRYMLKTRDYARVFKVTKAPLKEVGLEDFSIGNRELLETQGGDEEYDTRTGTVVYDAHDSYAIRLNHTIDSWIQRVNTYAPPVNTRLSQFSKQKVNLVSNGITLDWTRNVTVANCDFRNPQSHSGGGNGYMYSFQGNDDLLTNSTAVGGRHNYSFRYPHTSGNVVHKLNAGQSKYPSDFHMGLSAANLIDSPTFDRDYAESRYRDHGTTEHGQTTTQSVFWNVKSIACHPEKAVAVHSDQWGMGYVIGTQGACSDVYRTTWNNTAPMDWLEGKGQGASLSPSSLYESQLQRRKNGSSDDPPPSTQPTTPGVGVLASSFQDGNPPQNTRDDNLATRWSAYGDGQWIRYDLGAQTTVRSVKIAWYEGNLRKSRFDIRVSTDGVNWTDVVTNAQSSGTTTALESTSFSSRQARYVLIVGHGNATNLWNSLTEVKIE